MIQEQTTANFTLVNEHKHLMLTLAQKNQENLSENEQALLQNILKIQDDLQEAKAGRPVYALLQQLDEIARKHSIQKITLSYKDKKFKQKITASLNNKHSHLDVEIAFPLDENYSRRKQSRGGKSGHRWY